MKFHGKKPHLLNALVADSSGEIFELAGFAATGMAGNNRTALTTGNTVEMPYGGELMFLPDRRPVLFNIHSGRFETLHENPHARGEPVYPVAAFNSPGYVVSSVCAYRENAAAGCLPLFSYGAVGWYGTGFRSAVILVDREPRQDLRRMKREAVEAGVRRMRKHLPGNRLARHLERCALEYGCPAGKNFFLGRYEAPLPTSTSCNARCRGCLSFQQADEIPCSQNRIGFTPAPEEIAAVALEHIRRVPKAVVSFGQGCEGDPLLAVDVIAPAIKQIRRATSDGTINMNTNGSRPDILQRLFDEGLDAVRISINSFRKSCYQAYFRPRGYAFEDVVNSVAHAIKRKKFVAANYLNMPGFTDTPEEMQALTDFIRIHPIHMIQWRNLNFDPLKYYQVMATCGKLGEPMGMGRVLAQMKKLFPPLAHGYFNPPKENWHPG